MNELVLIRSLNMDDVSSTRKTSTRPNRGSKESGVSVSSRGIHAFNTGTEREFSPRFGDVEKFRRPTVQERRSWSFDGVIHTYHPFRISNDLCQGRQGPTLLSRHLKKHGSVEKAFRIKTGSHENVLVQIKTSARTGLKRTRSIRFERQIIGQRVQSRSFQISVL